MVRDIPMYSACEHHMLPWVGKAHVAYIPNDDGRVIGLSKLARLVDAYREAIRRSRSGSHSRVADEIDRTLQPKGVMVVIEAEHLCMSMPKAVLFRPGPPPSPRPSAELFPEQRRHPPRRRMRFVHGR